MTLPSAWQSLLALALPWVSPLAIPCAAQTGRSPAVQGLEAECAHSYEAALDALAGVFAKGLSVSGISLDCPGAGRSDVPVASEEQRALFGQHKEAAEDIQAGRFPSEDELVFATKIDLVCAKLGLSPAAAGRARAIYLARPPRSGDAPDHRTPAQYALDREAIESLLGSPGLTEDQRDELAAKARSLAAKLGSLKSLEGLAGPGSVLALGPGKGQAVAFTQVDKPKHPPPPPPGSTEPGYAAEKRRRETIDKIVSFVDPTRGSKESQKTAGRIIRSMLKDAPAEVLDNLAGKPLKIVIIPEGKHLLDMPEMAWAKGKKIAGQDRGWDTTYGVADIVDDKGNILVFAPEWSLTAKDGAKDSHGFPAKFYFTHEFGHIVKLRGLPAKSPAAGKSWLATATEWLAPWPVSGMAGSLLSPGPKPGAVAVGQDTFRDLYRERMKAGGFSDDYARASEEEYVGQSTAIFFGVGYDDSMKPLGPGWLKKNDPKMYEALVKMYGQPRSLGR